MKHNTFFRSIIAFLLIGSIALFSSCGGNSTKNEQGSSAVYGISTPTKKEDKKVRKFLTSFYNTYKNGGFNEAPRQAMMSSALQAAITHIRNYENFNGEIVLDSDPFINAQDIVGGLNSGNFNIEKVDDEYCIWKIAYNNGFETIQILVQVVSEDGEYKIHDVKYGEGDYSTTLLDMANGL